MDKVSISLVSVSQDELTACLGQQKHSNHWNGSGKKQSHEIQAETHPVLQNCCSIFLWNHLSDLLQEINVMNLVHSIYLVAIEWKEQWLIYMPTANNILFVSKDTVKDFGQRFPHSGLVLESPGTFSDRQSKAMHKTKREKQQQNLLTLFHRLRLHIATLIYTR